MLNEFQNHDIPKNIRIIASEKKIDSERIFSAMEDALVKSMVCAYGNAKVSVSIDHDSGAITIFELHKAVADADYDENHTILYEEEDDEESDSYFGHHEEEVEKPKKTVHYRAMPLKKAKEIDHNAKVGSILPIVIEGAWSNIGKSKNLIKIFNRNFARQLDVLMREQRYEFFLEKQGTIIAATVKRFAKEGYILMYDNNEILLPSEINFQQNNDENQKIQTSALRSETIKNERFSKLISKVKVENTINVFIKSVSDNKFAKYQVIASRTHPLFLAELLKKNVPEIRDEQIIIKNIERMPGLKAKVLVHSTDKSIDAVGACVGVRGVRIKSISEELNGERIDIIEDSDDILELIKNSMHPVKPLRIMIDEDEEKVKIAVMDQDLSSAIGKLGCNTKLLSRLLKMKVMMVSDTQDTTEKLNDFKKCVDEFKDALDVEEIIAQLLVSAGYKSLKSIANGDVANLMKVEYFDEELAQEIQSRAIEYIENQYKEKTKDIDKNYIDFLRSYIDDDNFVIKLIDGNIKNLNDFADLATDEVFDIVGSQNISEEMMGDIIIAARKKVGLID